MSPFFDTLSFVLSIIQLLVIGAVIIGVVAFFTRRKHPARQKQSLYAAKEIFSEFFLLFSLLFFSAFLVALNRQLHANVPLAWITFGTCFIGIAYSYRFSLRVMLLVSLVGLIGWWVVQGVLWAHHPSLLKDSLEMVNLEMPQMSKPQQGVSALMQPVLVDHIKYVVVLSGIILFSVFLYLLSYLHGPVVKPARFKTLYALFGIICMTCLLFTFSHRGGLDWFGAMTQGFAITASWQLLSVYVLLALVVLGLLNYLFMRKLASAGELLVLGVFALLGIAVAFLPPMQFYLGSAYWLSNGKDMTSIGFVFALFFNALLFLELVGIIFSGYQSKEYWRINLGAVLLFIFILVKYFDWFFTFLDKSVFFICAGILLFVVGYFMERGRRMVISAAMTKEEKK